jgi:Na+/pantothenate symporter
MPGPNPMRSLVAVLGGLLVLFVIGQVLELVIVRSAAAAPLENIDQYLAVRGRTGVLLGLLASQVVAALLAGYMTAKVAGVAELTHAAMAAAMQTALLVWGFTVGENAGLTPVWMRVATVVVTAPAMFAGASVRAKARLLQETT